MLRSYDRTKCFTNIQQQDIYFLQTCFSLNFRTTHISFIFIDSLDTFFSWQENSLPSYIYRTI